MGIQPKDPHLPFPLANAAQGLVHVFLRDLAIEAVIGVHRHEKLKPQPLLVNIDLTAREGTAPLDDRLAHVVDYEAVADGVRAVVAEGHVRLVETLAERIAAFCLGDERVLAVRVRIEKLAAIAGARSVGVEIERMRKD
jgi:7,8-dihydroneopterin aldolase/epimerase/oxygenase